MKGMKVALLAATIAAAASAPAGAWSGYNGVTIATSTAYQAGKASPPGILVILTSSPTDSEGCTSSNKGWSWIDFSSTGLPDGRTLYATVLAAQASGREVDIGVNGCASNGVPVVYAITVHS